MIGKVKGIIRNIMRNGLENDPIEEEALEVCDSVSGVEAHISDKDQHYIGPIRVVLDGMVVKRIELVGVCQSESVLKALDGLVGVDVASVARIPDEVVGDLKNENSRAGIDFIAPLLIGDGVERAFHWFCMILDGELNLFGNPSSEVDEIIKTNEKRLFVKDAMIEISQAVLGITKLEDLLSLVVLKTVQMVGGATHGSIMELDSHQYLNVVAHYGYNDEILCNFRLPLQESFIFKATDGQLDCTSMVMHEGMLNQDNRDKELKYYRSDSDVRYGLTRLYATICVPIVVNERFYGCMNIDTTIPDGFSAEDIRNIQYIRNQIQVILENHQLYDQTIYLSRYDKLTGVYNRGYFEEQLAEMLKDTDMFMLVIFDLGKLKYVNDVYGHTVGDSYLRQFAKTLKDYFGSHVLLGRYGGDEFIGIFRGIERNELIRIIDVLYVLFDKTPLLVGNNTNLTCRFHYGISEYPEDGVQLEELVSLAEKNMAMQKNGI